jgi:hypothetical protein
MIFLIPGFTGFRVKSILANIYIDIYLTNINKKLMIHILIMAILD